MKTSDLILRSLKDHGPLTSKSLSSILRLSVTTINVNLIRLAVKGKIEKTGYEKTKGKPSPIYYLFEPKHWELMQLFYRKEFDHARCGLQG